VQSIHSDLWNELFDLLEVKITVRSKRLQHGMTASLRLLSYRLSAAGLASEILEHLKDKEQESAPFVRQNILVNHLFDDFVQQSHAEEHPWNAATIQEIIKSLHDCKKQIEYIRQHRNEVGTSVEQTFLLIKMSQICNRMLLILDWMQHPDAFQQTNFLGYFTGLVKNQNLQNSIREFISQNYSLLAYQIAEHKGKKGLHYIAYAKKAYWILFKKSMQGGVVAGFMSMVKVMIANLGLPAFSQSILYSLNYATGFVFIDQTGSTLATKQPSYTASTVARSLDLKATEGHPNLKNLALTVAAMFRSQMASFAGNILLVFPVALLLAATCSDLFGYRLVDNEHALHLLEANHPFKSAALLYACVAGCFLFFSGLVAGYVENRILFARVPERMLHLPALRQILSKKRLHNWSDFAKRKMGAFVGSVSLAFMLGFASYFGKITGLPFDIRHVTLATGNVAIALYEVYDQVTTLDLLEIVFGLALIGMLNLLVSFTLAFMVAIRSRKINLKDYQEFAGILYRYFKRYPGDFFRSPSKLRSTDELS
jgi:site-specific recombinase